MTPARRRGLLGLLAALPIAALRPPQPFRTVQPMVGGTIGVSAAQLNEGEATLFADFIGGGGGGGAGGASDDAFRRMEGLTRAEALDRHVARVAGPGADLDALRADYARRWGWAHLIPPVGPPPPAGWNTLENVR